MRKSLFFIIIYSVRLGRRNRMNFSTNTEKLPLLICCFFRESKQLWCIGPTWPETVSLQLSSLALLSYRPSFNSTIGRAQISVLLLVTCASDLPLRVNKFCCVLLSSSRSCVLQAAINKDLLMCRRLCGKLHSRPSRLLFALHLSSNSQLFVQNHDFFSARP